MRCALLSSFPLVFLAACASGGGGGGLETTGTTPVTTRVVSGAGGFDLNSTDYSQTAVHWVRAPADRIWDVLPEVYTELGIDAGVVNAEAKQFGTRSSIANRRLAGERISEYLDCGSNAVAGEIADAWRVQFSLISTLRGSGDAGTELRTVLDAQASPRTVSGATARCRSTGRLEARITEMVEARIEA